MARKAIVILPIATALASLAGLSAGNDTAKGAVPDNINVFPASTDPRVGSRLAPNSLVSVGEDLLGFVLTQGSDEVAQHYSHSSHVSHASHHSHYSSRY